MRLAICAIASVVLCASSAWAARAPREVRALVKRYCQGCHGPSQAKGGLRFDRIDFDLLRGQDGERWRSVLKALQEREMPPAKQPQPRDPQRQRLIGWLQAGLDQAARSKQAGTPSLLRRLTREQHSNTLRDLLGVASDYTRLLPPESPSAMGMHNDGRVLASSALHLEQTMKIARLALDRALSLGAPPPAWRFRFVFGPQKRQPARPVDLGFQALPLAPDEYLVETFADRGPVKTATLTPKGEVRDRCYVDLRGSADPRGRRSRRYRVDARGLLLMPARPHVERGAQVWQGPDPHVSLVLRDFPAEGPFVLRLSVSRADPDDDAPWLRAFAGNRLDDGMEYATFGRPTRVDAPPGQPQIIELRGRLENLPIPVVDPADQEFLSNLMVIGVWNDVLVSRAEAASPALVIEAMEFEGPVTEAWPSASHRRVFFDDALAARPAEYARQILQRFLRRAFRRPPTPAQIDRYLAYWRQAAGGAGFEEAVRDTLAAALASPSFLHQVEEGHEDGAGRRTLDDHALASRLSYFLWNSMPDDELLDLAARGGVRANLTGQAARLLADPRARDFFEVYAGQWLDLGALDQVRVDVERHPRYTRFVKEDMRLETTRFLEHLFRQNRPLSELVDAGYTLLNGNLAGFYGIAGVSGPEFRVVPMPPGGRGGGLLTQGSFLVGHATGVDSHPIKRGVWLAKKLLDDPPPPPPPNVPEIDREDPEIARMPVKAQLERHRSRESCRGCHRKIDPWGLPFEGFDAAGLPREPSGAVDARSELPDGTAIDGVPALRAYLLGQRRDQLRRSAARHLAAYALGRTPSFVDEKDVLAIAARARARGDGLRDLLMAVVESESFASK